MAISSGNGSGRSRSWKGRQRVLLAIILGIYLMVALFGDVWVGLGGAAIFAVAAYLDRRVFPYGLHRRLKAGWLVISALLGAFLGSAFVGNCSHAAMQSINSAIHTMEGAVVGAVIGMAVDLAINLPSGPIGFRFRLWHVFAYCCIVAACLYIVFSYIDMLKIRAAI
jgi:hypothetical protein